MLRHLRWDPCGRSRSSEPPGLAWRAFSCSGMGPDHGVVEPCAPSSHGHVDAACLMHETRIRRSPAQHGRLLRARSEVARHRLHRRSSRRRCNRRHRLRGASQAQRFLHRPLRGASSQVPEGTQAEERPTRALVREQPFAGLLVGVVCVGGLVRWQGFFSDGDGPEAGLSDPNHGPLAAPQTNTSEANAQKIHIALCCCGLVLNLYAPRMRNMRGPSITICSYKLGLQPFRADVVVPGCLAWQRCGICVGLRHPENS